MSSIVHPRPRLTSAEFSDDFEMDLEFQFVPSSFSVNIGANYAEGGTLNRQHPITQWTRGKSKTIAFEAKFFARDTQENIDDTLAKLEQATSRVEALGRPPLLIFSWGRVFSEFVVIEDLGNVVVDELRPDGTHQGFLLRIQLRRYDFFDLKLTDPTAPPHDSFVALVRQGDTWEHLAARQYKNPLQGDLLRRRNPDKPFLTPGQVVVLLDRENIRGVPVLPESPPLARTHAFEEVRDALFALRSGARTTHIGTVGS